MFVPHPSLVHWERKLFAPEKLMKWTVSRPYELWGHQFLTEMIFMSCKKILKALRLVQFVTSFIEKYMNFLFQGHIFGHPQHLNAITFTLDAAMIKHDDICLWISSFSYIINFKEVDKFFMFQGKGNFTRPNKKNAFRQKLIRSTITTRVIMIWKLWETQLWGLRRNVMQSFD